MKNKLRIAEIFHSLQGEGNTMGLPSVFFRLAGCNLLCGNPSWPDKPLVDMTQEEIYQHQGQNAEWTCDTISVWLKGERRTLPDIVEDLKATYGREFLQGSQLVITGGEPLIQQELLPEFISLLRERLHKIIRVEVETNGTIVPSKELTMSGEMKKVSQWNVSPKLSNSGMSVDKRINPKAIHMFVRLAYENRAIFKFVITKEEDIDEVMATYIEPSEIPTEKVYLMPGCSNREQFEKVAPLVAKLCTDKGYHFSSRLQINLWNEVTGV